ncbi:MAG: hypothetical protein K6G31_04000 [Paludibacteraceae bacterium]|nr:hypothetical protein [Paludibacteraceae bacterium]
MELEYAYYFPWVRKGISNKISEVDTLGEGCGDVLLRPKINLTTNIKASSVNAQNLENANKILSETKSISLTGPGDVLKINEKAIKLVRPEDGFSGFANEYLPYIEFTEPDFLWRYTPASVCAGRLRPWLALIVCEVDKCNITKAAGGTFVVSFSISEREYAEIFPDPSRIDCAAHAQGFSKDKAEFCRLVAFTDIMPEKRMAENKEYVALLIPSFEVGRLRGIGRPDEEIENVKAQKSAWEKSYASQVSEHVNPFVFPCYFHWKFTAGGGSFESLVRKLSAASSLNDSLQIDVSRMGEGLDFDQLYTDKDVRPRSIVKMPVATKSVFHIDEPFPDKEKKEESFLYERLRDLISKNPVFGENIDSIEGTNESEKDDPWVVPPAYGAKHIMATGLDVDGKQWFTDVNLDVCYRAAAGLGKKVVQINQEEFVSRAWRQVELVKQQNSLLHNMNLSSKVDNSIKGKNLKFLQTKRVKENRQPGMSKKRVLARMMVNLPSMRKTRKKKDSPTISSIMEEEKIPQSFASASFRCLTENISKLTNSLDLTSVTENIAEKQIFRQKEPMFGLMPTTDNLNNVCKEIFSRVVAHSFDNVIGDFISIENDKFYRNIKRYTSYGSNRFYRYLSFLKNHFSRELFNDPLEIYRVMELFVLCGGINNVCIGSTVDKEDTIKSVIDRGENEGSFDFIHYSYSGFIQENDVVGIPDSEYVKIFGEDKPITRIRIAKYTESDRHCYMYVFSIQKLYSLACEKNNDFSNNVIFLKNYIFEDNIERKINGLHRMITENGVYNPKMYYTVYRGYRGDRHESIARISDACYMPEFYVTNYYQVFSEWNNLYRISTGKYSACGLLHSSNAYEKASEELRDLYKSYQEMVVNYLLYTPDNVIIYPEAINEKYVQVIDSFEDYKTFCRTLKNYNNELKCFFDFENVVNSLKSFENEEKPNAVDTDGEIDGLQSDMLKASIKEKMENAITTYYGNYSQADYLKGLLSTKYPIMAHPQFPEPTCYYLQELSDKFLLACIDELPADSISMFVNNGAFVEAFLCGMNTEMGKELLWREYPTDQRGSYFRKFWDCDVDPESVRKNTYFDVENLHQWKGKLGENHMSEKSDLLQFIIKGELMKVYPETRIYLQRVQRGTDGNLELVKEEKVEPVAQAFLKKDIYVVGFKIKPSEVIGNPAKQDYGYMLMFEQDAENSDFKHIDKKTEKEDCRYLVKNGIMAVKPVIFGKHPMSIVKKTYTETDEFSSTRA